MTKANKNAAINKGGNIRLSLYEKRFLLALFEDSKTTLSNMSTAYKFEQEAPFIYRYDLDFKGAEVAIFKLIHILNSNLK